MRIPRILAALVLSLVPLAQARAQIDTGLGAAETSASGVSAPAAAASRAATASPAPMLVPALSGPAFVSAPAATLAPSARPNEAALPASALVPAAAASAGAETPAPKAAAAAPAPSEPPAASPAAPPSSPPVYFVEALRNLGVPETLTSRLVEFLSTRHPGDQNSIYHGLGHSQEVAGYAARVAENADLPAARKILLIFAASLHDVDPARVPDTPARVSATLAHLDGDPEAQALLSEFGARYGFNAGQVKALIMGTDFSMDPAEMKSKQDAFVAAAREAFPGEDFGVEWGRRLAFVDQSSTYLGGPELARRRVEGLAHEIRSNLKALGKNGGPTDAQMLAGTAKFLSVLRQNPDFQFLPSDLQRQFDDVQTYFSARQTPEAWAAAAPAPARAPPDLDAAREYVRSIAGAIKLNDRQTDGLLLSFFEESGIAPGSPRAEAVRGAMLPARVADEEKALDGLSPELRRRRSILLRLASERRTTPTAIEGILKRRGALDQIAGLKDEDFERQANLALDRDELERAVHDYPQNTQGQFMRSVADAMATVSGKSVEEIARDGVFAYIDFQGSRVRRASIGRDPDVRSVQMVLYITRRDGRWRIGGYRQNRETGRSDGGLVEIVKKWLVSGGVPAKDLE